MDIEGSERGIMGNMTLETAKKIKQITMEVHDHSIKNITFLIKKLYALGFKTIFYFDKEVYASKLKKGSHYVKTS